MNICMSSKCDSRPIKRERIDVQFDTEQERQDYRVFLKTTGRKAGSWVRTLILEAMKKEGATA